MDTINRLIKIIVNKCEKAYRKVLTISIEKINKSHFSQHQKDLIMSHLSEGDIVFNSIIIHLYYFVDMLLGN